MTIFTVSGMSFFLRLKSFEKTSMMAVAWDVPQRPRPIMPGPQAPTRAAAPRPLRHGAGSLLSRTAPARHATTVATAAGPTVDPSRLHTAYTIEVVHRTTRLGAPRRL